ncbi:hypothetical protein ACN5ZK_04175 [Macrococcoides bohemicum]|uniref:hypothetical protein n=1 Tax=Macrococcoides bohemicum TaxID=1903056 RepID=UPI003B003849
MLQEQLDGVFIKEEDGYFDEDKVGAQFYSMIKQLSGEEAYELIDEAINYLLQSTDTEVVAYMLEFISSLYGIAGTNELTDLHEMKASIIDRQVEIYGNQFTHNVLNNLKRELGTAT